MNVETKITAAGALLIAWSLVIGAVLLITLETDQYGSIWNALNEDAFSAFILAADLAAFILGIGAVASGLSAQKGSVDIARRIAGAVGWCVISYGLLASAVIIIVVRHEGADMVRTTLAAVVVAAVLMLWIGLVRAALRRFDGVLAARSDERF